MNDVRSKLKTLPPKPGVYLFKDLRGEIIYVGKAKNLKNRVKSYFPPHPALSRQGRGIKEEIMTRQIADLDWVIVSSELESLILENILIKQHKPRFNVRLRDDKNYHFIKIDYDYEIPQVYPVRKIPIKRGQAKYFGPYTSGLSVKNTLHLIKKIFLLCRNKRVTGKPCFAYHLKRCPGVCFGQIPPAEYRQTFREIEKFLRHEQADILRLLKAEMKEAAQKRQFEKAALTRDKIRTLSHLWEKQKIISVRNENQDYLGVHQTPAEAVVFIFQVRGGRLLSQENLVLAHQNAAFWEILEKFILQYYADASFIPKEIFVPVNLPNFSAMQRALTKLKGSHVKIAKPTRGKKKKLLALAAENAQMFYERELASFQKNAANVLPELQRILNLPVLPERIEGYDISNIQGTNPVGSMVVFAGGKPATSEYRKFKINLPETPNDFAMMREILTRRFQHSTSPLTSPGLRPPSPRQEREILKSSIASHGWGGKQGGKTLSPGEGRVRERSLAWPLPDLIVIDGGKGQLNIALSVLKQNNLNISAIGLAKRLEEIFLPGQKQPLILPPNSPALFLLQQIRDEAHRFAVTFHRGRRKKIQTASRLDEIPGIGPATRKKLIQKFGSLSAVRRISLDALAEEVGMKTAQKIKERL